MNAQSIRQLVFDVMKSHLNLVQDDVDTNDGEVLINVSRRKNAQQVVNATVVTDDAEYWINAEIDYATGNISVETFKKINSDIMEIPDDK